LVLSKLPAAAARHQIHKVGTGTTAVIGLMDPETTAFQEDLTNTINWYGTNNSALIGKEVGALEAEVGDGAGNLVRSKLLAAALEI
jgi:hypothetical protein